jgi:hypothetical protein
MNFFQTQDFFKKMYPNTLITFEFDIKCIRTMEIIHTDGKANPVHHLEYNKVKVSVPGKEPMYVDIQPHRMCCDLNTVKEHIKNIDPLDQ